MEQESLSQIDQQKQVLQQQLNISDEFKNRLKHTT
jgi:hypothetical protein